MLQLSGLDRPEVLAYSLLMLSVLSSWCASTIRYDKRNNGETSHLASFSIEQVWLLDGPSTRIFNRLSVCGNDNRYC